MKIEHTLAHTYSHYNYSQLKKNLYICLLNVNSFVLICLQENAKDCGGAATIFLSRALLVASLLRVALFHAWT